MKFIKLLICSAFFLISSVFFLSKPVFAETPTLKPELSWQRSAEDPTTIITETGFAQVDKLQSALQSSYLDPGQTVFDNGQFTPEPNKSTATAVGASWASWPHNYPCFRSYELRRFQATFNLPSINPANIEKVKLVSPYYPGDIFPINDNAYIYFNGHQIAAVGTHYIGADQGGPSTETDKWIVSGDFGTTPIQYLQVGTNTIDIITEELCGWGGMGKLDLVLDLKAPLGPAPFLDLPWDYQNSGLDFNEAAQSMGSYFDHEYPLLSAGLIEPIQLLNFFGIKDIFSYSSHDGYDYAKKALVNLGDSVLAAADGCASYDYNGAGGNIIKINHGNGYQTRYLHLLDDNKLITKSSNCVQVSKGQIIGSVGYTGNVQPPGEAGAHIHFMVIQDKNGDGNFDDNIPDGVTDPFGWQSAEPDPWSNFSFNYGGQSRTGNASFYLWTKPIANLSDHLNTNGGFFELERYSANFPQGATTQDLNLAMESAPTARPSNTLQSVGSTMIITAKDLLGNFVKVFAESFTLKIGFSNFDLSPYNLGTISIYSSDDGINWNKEQTSVDLNNKTATAQVNHLTHFALMAERKDTISPTTTAVLSGDQSEQNWFRSNVQLTLGAQDNPDGLGVDYTLYRVNDGDWKQYTGPVSFADDGIYTIEFYSVDKDENIENDKTISFNIDKTPPEAKVFIDQNKQELVVAGIDANQTTVTRTNNPTTKKKDDAVYVVTDQAGNTLKLDVRDRDKEKKDKFQVYSLQYNTAPSTVQPKNYFNVEYHEKKDKLNVVEQNFQIKDEVKIRIKYDSKKNQSTIITKQNGKEKVKEVKPGLILLQLITNKGKIEYSY